MAAESTSVLVWRNELAALQERLGRLFGRPEPRRQVGLYLEGLLSAAERKNGWQLAEEIGDARPWRTQRVLSHVLWDADAAQELCRDYVFEHLGAADGVLIVDETGFLKKGEHSVGVARQYSGTAGRIENVQIGVFLAYASRLVRECGQACRGGYPGCGRLRHQAGLGARDDRARPGCRPALCMGAGR
jgi:SRSO17 transposase